MRENRFQLRINWGDTDKAGIVYYPNYFKWFDIAGHQFFRSVGLAPSDLEENHGVIIPLLDARCSFEEPLLYDDVVTIKTVVEEISRKTIKLKHEVYRGETRTGHGYEVRAWVKEVEGKYKAVIIPDDIRKLLQETKELEFTQNNPWLSA